MTEKYPMVTYCWGKPLSECSNGEIVNALRYAKDALAMSPDIFGSVMKEAVERKILPDAMWLVNA
jgi:hypothetical protein